MFQHRRYRRLFLALSAALIAHLVLLLSGDWGILLFSAPSKEDRVLTLTLENTAYEGLRETAVADAETVNDVPLEKPRPRPKEIIELPKSIEETAPLVNAKRLDKASVASDISAEANVEPAEAENEYLELTASEPVPPLEEIEMVKQFLPSNYEKLLVADESAELNILTNLFSSENESAELEKVSPPPITQAVSPVQERMLEKKLQQLASKLQNTEFVENNELLEKPISWTKGGQVYSARLKQVLAANDMQTDELLVEVKTEKDGQQLTTSLRLKKLAFSNFAQFVHRWDPNVSIHDDVMDGRFHSNTRINIVGDRNRGPVFRGKATTASHSVNYEGNASKKKTFKGGLETGVKRILMPKPRQLFDESDADQRNAVLIKQNARLIFTADGHYLWQAIDEVGPMRKFSIGDTPLYLLAAPGVTLWLSGVVNGAVAVYSPKRLYIEGDIRYASIESLENGGDFLGLVSPRSVVIAGRDKVSAGDLNVHAAIYAGNRFAVKGLAGPRMGTLNIFGSVSASTISATEPRFATNIVFDKRLENLRPPGFPVTDRYEVLARANQWVVAQDAYLEAAEDQLTNEGILDGAPAVDGVFTTDGLKGDSAPTYRD